MSDEVVENPRLKVKAQIDHHVKLIAVSAVSLAEARERAGKFLTFSTILLDYQKNLKVAISKLITLCNARYADAMSSTGSIPVAEKKALSENNEKYTLAREALEDAQAEEKWIEGYITIFKDAHLLYRQYSKE